ncbi:glutamyl-tRNA(Gln) amidotransferase, C subunit [Caldicellulosiruptor acetigenus I77R1B]|uniref:Aspartyl/glutamyl-tRNA(Asn/Gln) amidotransferase subunit C n=2 Tax=Caldicellulosiruptor acetigenus TaxID=301953 RepID=G2PYC4_9FIRM|nr:Asp-tRNA(Asn)/Glu-tRNA(Gln) amidotransferase subunit GatC [Caldicellulosiruptor acetigenus]ADQ41431.1 glutamyl-tRNA(Gln) amidotransferase, C subunit [Caldicellulosiruptor acetigenus I77R1B]AEM73974.1 Aspartyl/glutamyl-tRNA(Asn/Gln) amidotransferase subunit C [Caldicellulosiruptor acetigenus 6A]WAM35576.1 Asp-tRNA(Asn)/Glu-tRNA(Gln) amidotransferase subunit GatC [Caldicellulosiruptor acetigenus]
MITRDDVEYVANLARLTLTEEEIEKMTKELGAIIEFANKLSDLDTKDVEPTAHVLNLYNVFRSDEVKPSYPREKILQNAPSHDDVCIKVPKIVE